MRVKPEKARVIDPRTGKPLPDEGANVPDNSYWRRRLRDGDVSHAPEKKAAPKPRKTETPQEHS